MTKFYNKISFKLGVLFSSIFLVLLLLLGFILYQVFSHTFIDYITEDLLIRGNNHARALSEKFNESTIKHVGFMEENVVTRVVVTDKNKRILSSSDPVDDEMLLYIERTSIFKENIIINRDWNNYEYLATVSAIRNGEKGYVYMFYPTDVIQETAFVLKVFMVISSFGVVLIAIGIIGFLSKMMANPLLKMKEATEKMAHGNYKQELMVKGKDELAQLGLSIQSLGEQLQHYEETRNDFLAAVSHELRTPLTYMKGYSDVLLKDVVENKEEQKGYLKIINEEAKRVTHLVNDLFELTKLQAGKFNLIKEDVVIFPLIKKVMNHLNPLADEKGLSLHLDYRMVDDFHLRIDPYRMEQVFFNLIENAIKYTEQGMITVTIFAKDKFLVVEIEDTGIGIPKKDLSKIWDRFYRVDKSRTRKTGGTGLGLYIVKELIQLHDGKINVQSTEGAGTKVTVILPKEN